MNIVIISDFTSRELFIVEKVIAEYPSAVVVQPVSGLQKTENRSNNNHSVKHIVNRITWKLHRLLWERKFYPDKNYPVINNNFFIPFSILNKPEGIKIFSDLAPDILITCRAPLLCEELIQIPEIAAVNIHFGLSPNYRGNDTLFWPLYYKDYSHLGGCIHHITPGIDTGNILAEVYPPLKALDGEIAVDYNTTVLLAEAAVQYLKSTEQSGTRLPGKPQKENGRNFNLTDRTFGKSLSYLMRRSVGLSMPPKRRGEIVTHFMPPD